jgi:hypothetical protein
MPQTQQTKTFISSNRTLPTCGSSTSTERSLRVKSAPSRSSTKAKCEGSSAKPTLPADSSTENIVPCQISGTRPFVRTVNFKTVLDFFHLPNLTNASRDEAIFLHILYSQLATQAELLAAILPYSVQRPLRELFAAMNEPGRNYSAQNAKRKRPSNSSAALKAFVKARESPHLHTDR